MCLEDSEELLRAQLEQIEELNLEQQEIERNYSVDIAEGNFIDKLGNMLI